VNEVRTVARASCRAYNSEDGTESDALVVEISEETLSAMNAPIPPNEAERLELFAITTFWIRPPETAFDRITSLAANYAMCPLPSSRWWTRSSMVQGLLWCRQAPDSRELSFCAHAYSSEQVMVWPDAMADRRFVDNGP